MAEEKREKWLNWLALTTVIFAVCATTHAAEPVVLGRWLEPGMHVNSVGFNIAGREVDAVAVAKSLLVVESREVALAPPPVGANEIGWAIRDGAITAEHIHAEIGELVSGKKTGRTSPEQITLYKSVGIALQDAVARQVDDDGGQPGGETRLAPILSDLAPGGHEGVLDDVGGVLTDAGHAQGDIEEHALMPQHQTFEGRCITSPAGRDQGFVTGRISLFHLQTI